MGNSYKQIAIRQAYADNPHRCRYCDGPIPPKPGVKLAFTRKQIYCSKSCSAKVNNVANVAPKRKRKPRVCKGCGAESFDKRSDRRLCQSCWESYCNKVKMRTKAEAGRRVIASHAAFVARRPGDKCQ